MKPWRTSTTTTRTTHHDSNTEGNHTMKTPLAGGISRRVLLSLGILGTVGAVAGLGTYATFTDSTNSAHSISTGTLSIDLATAGSSGFTLAADELAAGDTVQRAVDLTIGGTIDTSTIAFETTSSSANALVTDATNGLQLIVERCSQPWTEAGASPGFTYTCAGTTSTVSAAGPVIRSSAAATNLGTSASTQHLRFRWTLPSTAGNALQALTSSITYDFVATQRAATNR